MNTQTFTTAQQSVLTVLKNKHLTSSEIVAKVENITLLLELYPMLEALRKLGAIRSYNQGEIRYHTAA